MAHTRTAVVLGGSVAGLITAQVLSDLYDTVTVIDRDTPPDAVLPRRGVPQSPATTRGGRASTRRRLGRRGAESR
jgi:2-polyprenyl-6-methoxyphenol hydroxylase-like FAD-dependent oxidoreductase